MSPPLCASPPGRGLQLHRPCLPCMGAGTAALMSHESWDPAANWAPVRHVLLSPAADVTDFRDAFASLDVDGSAQVGAGQRAHCQGQGGREVQGADAVAARMWACAQGHARGVRIGAHQCAERGPADA